MQKATRETIAVFGVINTIAAFEHGLGEFLQGNRAPESAFILSWPDAPFFQIHGGEPALTLIPNLLVSGILSMLLALVFLAWATLFAGRRHAGLEMIAISILLLLVGGGFGPPLLGIILGTALVLSRRSGASGAGSLRSWFAHLWPWLFAAAAAAWLMVFPGLNLLDFAFRVTLPDALVYTVIFSALGLLIFALWAGAARDRAQRERIEGSAV